MSLSSRLLLSVALLAGAGPVVAGSQPPARFAEAAKLPTGTEVSLGN